jgi:formylglycine-generating enzyme required for sulfatase activity
MGSPEDEAEREEQETLHRVTLTRGFWMGVTPVAQGQWQAVMGNNPSFHSRTGGGKDRVAGISDEDLSRFPVETVSWEDAQAFCAKLSEGLSGRVTLPTEAEWEYGCRAGTRTPFHFGCVLNGTQANCRGGYPYGTEERGPNLGRPTVVGSYAPNAWGLLDCHGQLWEWCADWYDERYYSVSEDVDPKESLNGDSRVLRGGPFYFGSRFCRAAYRSRNDPGVRSSNFGFRVCFRPA